MSYGVRVFHLREGSVLLIGKNGGTETLSSAMPDGAPVEQHIEILKERIKHLEQLAAGIRKWEGRDG